MTSTTPRDILSLALHDAGVVGTGQTPLAEDINNAFTRLNWMMAQWNRKRWLVYHLITRSVVSNGSVFYNVGPGQDLDLAVRPARLEAAFFRQLVQSQPNEIDYPLEILNTWEEYSLLALKELQSFPSYIFYDTGWPIGKVYPWPVPQSTIYEIFIVVMEVLAQFTNLSQVIDLPDEYFAAIHFNMAVRLRLAYRLPPDPGMVMLAKDALNTIRGANTQIARLQVPQDLLRPGVYNPYSDQIR